ncbi:MAG TPA: bifunctional (p)ppGpp synthetase/guanosine-3',5'-bis(diphosphate) 3'-pyrophosphohydrolase [Haloplasmataceae bacterium]
MSLVEQKYQELQEHLKNHITKPESLEFIHRAFLYSKQHHGDQVRKSGEPYIIHPLEVAIILADLRCGPATIAAGLLHDVLEDTDVTYERLVEDFGEEIATLVDGVTKLGKIKFVSKEQEQSKNHQKMFLAMAKDIRVILIKLADRLHNMRTLKYMPRQKQIEIAQETLEIFAPIAHRLGIYNIKSELEDRALRYIDPDEYYYIARLIDEKKKEREKDIEAMAEAITDLLKQYQIKFEIKGRAKSIYSVHKKMRQRNVEFSEIFDLLALRIIVEDEATCYQVLGLIHAHWKPIPKRFKDYIAMPKPNMYQSLHTTVIGINGKIFEIQIRTYEMDAVAEYGVAAHWAYKEGQVNSPSKEQLEIQEKLRWYKNMVEYSENGDGEELLNLLIDDIFSANVYVFTPKGDVLDFPSGATPIDFAYRIHTEVGNRTVGAIVNGRIVPLTYELQTGDVVEIKTSKNSFGPSEGWLKIAKTAHARSKIKQFFNKQNRKQFIDMGREMVMKALEDHVEDVYEFISSPSYLSKFSKQGIQTVEDLYYAVGKKIISTQTLIAKAETEEQYKKDDVLLEIYQQPERIEDHQKRTSPTGILVEGLDNPQIKISKCCTPIPGDEIIGYVTKGKGITVHRKDCQNVKNAEPERLISVYWEEGQDERKYEVDLKISCFSRNNILLDIINTINAAGHNILSVSADMKKSGNVVIKTKLMIENSIKLNHLVTNLKKVKDVYSVERFDK